MRAPTSRQDELTLAWLRIDSLPASQTSSVKDLDVFGAFQSLLLRNLTHFLERYDLGFVKLSHRVVDLVNGLWLPAFRRETLLYPFAKVV